MSLTVSISIELSLEKWGPPATMPEGRGQAWSSELSSEGFTRLRSRVRVPSAHHVAMPPSRGHLDLAPFRESATLHDRRSVQLDQ
jgi:hypothetical protein